MYNIKLVIAYTGSSFFGWQKTKMGPSVEGILEKALLQILQHEVKIQAASRTDAGVHAEGQAAHFMTSKPCCLSSLQYALNAILPKEIAVISVEKMPQDFHPTLSCLQKEYAYQLCYGRVQMPFFRQTSWHFPYCIHMELMQQAAKR